LNSEGLDVVLTRLTRTAIFQTINKLKSRPDVVYRANFYINEAGRESDVANGVPGDVGGYTGRFFWPGYPEHSICREFSGEPGEFRLQHFLGISEQNNQIKRFS